MRFRELPPPSLPPSCQPSLELRKKKKSPSSLRRSERRAREFALKEDLKKMLAQEKETTQQLKSDHSTGAAGPKEAVPSPGGTREAVPPLVCLPHISPKADGSKAAVPPHAVPPAAGPPPVLLPGSSQTAALPRDKQLLRQLLEFLALQLQTPCSSLLSASPSPQANTSCVAPQLPEADTPRRRTRDPRLRTH